MKHYYLILISVCICFSQTKRDPRVVGLAGSYTTIADGIFSIGYNPGLIGLQQNRPFMMQLGQIDFGILGNFFSIENMAKYSGDTLDTSEKDQIFRQLRDSEGLSFFQDLHIPTPILNISKGNLAFTSNNIFLSNYRLPIGLLEFMFYGNAQKTDLDMELNYEILGVNELAVTFGMPFKFGSLGFTIKRLQGLFYLGIDDDSSRANLETSDLGIIGSGKYVIRQGLGGTGFALDVGIVSKPINGWSVGTSLINIFGNIDWNKSLAKPGNSFGFYPFEFGGDQLDPGESILFTYSIDTLRADKLSDSTLFVNETSFFPDTSKFTTEYPAIFRLGVSKQLETFLIASDLVTGFQNAYYSKQGWRWSIGFEWTKIPSTPMRIGYAWAGGDLRELGLGFGYHKGPIIFDIGFAFRNGLWIHTMKGLNISAGITITSLKSRNIKDGESKEKEGFLERLFRTIGLN